jgi:membrane associated rhomboid family serine protease
MIPIGDRNPTRRFPIVNYLLLAANIAMFVYELSLGVSRLDRFIDTWGVRSTDVIALLGGQVGLLVPVLLASLVSMFLHGGWLHIFFNMLFLWVFGNNVEDSMGKPRFALFYLLGGLAAAVTQVAVSTDSTVPLVGASGAIAAVLGGYALLYPRARVLTIFFLFFIFFLEIPAMILLGLWILLQFLPAVGQLATPEVGGGGGTAYFAHIGGFLVGLAAIKLFAHRRSSRYDRPRYPVY